MAKPKLPITLTIVNVANQVPVPRLFSRKLKDLFFFRQCIGWLAFSTGHFKPGISVSCVTLACTDKSLHLGQAVTTYLCQDLLIGIGVRGAFVQFKISVSFALYMRMCHAMFLFWPLALKRRPANCQFSLWIGESGKRIYWQFKLNLYILRKYILADASPMIIFQRFCLDKLTITHC